MHSAQFVPGAVQHPSPGAVQHPAAAAGPGQTSPGSPGVWLVTTPDASFDDTVVTVSDSDTGPDSPLRLATSCDDGMPALLEDTPPKLVSKVHSDPVLLACNFLSLQVIDFDQVDSEDGDGLSFQPVPQHPGIRVLSGPGPALPVPGDYVDPEVPADQPSVVCDH